MPTISELAGEHFYCDCVYVFMTCEELQIFDLVQQNTIIAEHWGRCRKPQGSSVSRGALLERVPAQAAQRAALGAGKLPDKHLLLISRNLLLDRAPRSLDRIPQHIQEETPRFLMEFILFLNTDRLSSPQTSHTWAWEKNKTHTSKFFFSFFVF